MQSDDTVFTETNLLSIGEPNVRNKRSSDADQSNLKRRAIHRITRQGSFLGFFGPSFKHRTS